LIRALERNQVKSLARPIEAGTRRDGFVIGRNLVTFPVPDTFQILEIFLLFKVNRLHHCGFALNSPLPNADINSPHGNYC
jgi:hypothetical protein